MPNVKPDLLPTFEMLNLKPELLRTLIELGYEKPTPIQDKTIPVLLKGKDLLAQAQTGTGKTAAFALPILNRLDVTQLKTQALVLAPTRELAIQVAEAFQSYAKYLPGFHILPIYGGQDFGPQLRALNRGVHVVVGTPGRIMDHLRRGTLKIESVKTVVLDEADEMLNMGFIDDVQWILDKITGEHQTALFSATMPGSIQRISGQYLKEPEHIRIQATDTSVKSIEQFYVEVFDKNQKMEVLTRFLEVEDFEAAIIFTRTKNASTEVAEKLAARGYSAAAINGDMAQSTREQVIKRLKNKALDIVVATEVAARGLDVERITYVINYDAPSDVESYVHRVGRTGRAGRKGKALLILMPRERRMLRDIERMTHQPMQPIKPPSFAQVKEKRWTQFAEKIAMVLANNKNLEEDRQFVEKLADTKGWSAVEIASALVSIAQNPAGKVVDVKNADLFGSEKVEREHKAGRDRPPYRGGSERGGDRGGERGGERGGARGDRGGYAGRGGNRGGEQRSDDRGNRGGEQRSDRGNSYRGGERAAPPAAGDRGYDRGERPSFPRHEGNPRERAAGAAKIWVKKKFSGPRREDTK